MTPPPLRLNHARDQRNPKPVPYILARGLLSSWMNGGKKLSDFLLLEAMPMPVSQTDNWTTWLPASAWILQADRCHPLA